MTRQLELRDTEAQPDEHCGQPMLSSLSSKPEHSWYSGSCLASPFPFYSLNPLSSGNRYWDEL